MSDSRRLSVSALLALTAFCSACVAERVIAEPPRRQDSDRPYQREDIPNGDEDPPSWVARLNYIQGPVSFRPGEIDDWTQATLNYPLRGGDHLWVDEGGLAELHVGSTALRLNQYTALALLNFDDRLVQLRLTDGTLEVHVRHLEGQHFEVATPQGAVTISRPGEYRVDVSKDGGRTTVTCRRGETEVLSNGSSLDVDSGHSLILTGGDQPTYDLTDAVGASSFEGWCAQRDWREEQSQSVRYVGREMIGYEDLDENGTWADVVDYGPVWRPRVAAGWAPYRHGHWAWVGPWGWTWVDDAPWGFAPFHYGRWAYLDGGWGWIPGRVMARPVYAPALVVFVGGSGFHASVSFGGGAGVAWFPLGPHEVYRPAYHVSNTYVQNLNSNHVTNINVTNVNITNINYVNRGVVGAVTAVPQTAFVSSRSVSASAVSLSPGALRQAQITGATAFVAPSRESVLARPGTPIVVARPPSALVNRAVVSRTPPPPPPLPFAARQQAMAANPGRPLDSATLQQLRQRSPVSAPPVRSAATAAAALRPAREGLPAPKPMVDRVNTPPQPNPHQPSQEPTPTRPVDRPMDRQVQRPVDRPADRTAQPPADRPVGRPVQRPEDRPVEHPVQRPVESPVQRPVDRPVQRPVDRPVDRPAPREEKRVEKVEVKRDRPKKEEPPPKKKEEEPHRN